MAAAPVRHADKVSDFVLESEAPGATLSRRHPKIKDKFEQRRKELDAERAAAEAKRKRTKDKAVAAERIDPRWRIVEDTSRIKGAQPFIVIEQAFFAIVRGGEELVVKTTKLGTTPVAVTVCSTLFEQLMQTFEAFMGEGLFAGIDHARSKAPAVEHAVTTDLLRDTAKMLSGYGYSVRADLQTAAKGGSDGHAKVDTLQDVMPAFIAEMIALVEATKEALLPLAHLIGEENADQVAFLAECLSETGALTASGVVSFVVSKSGMAANLALAQEYIDAVKQVCDAEEYATLTPAMRRAFKASADKLNW